MEGVNNPAFSEVERKISHHSLQIPIDLSQVQGLEALEPNGRHRYSSVDDETDKSTETPCCLISGRLAIDAFLAKKSSFIKKLGLFLFNVLVAVYFVYATLHWKRQAKEGEFEWCKGYGMLIIILGTVYFGLFYYLVIKRYFGKAIKRVFHPLLSCIDSIRNRRMGMLVFKTTFYVAVLIAVIVFLVYDTIGSRDRLISSIGLLALLIFGWIFSKYPGQINWRPVICGLILQFVFGLITIRWTIGRAIFQCFSEKVASFLDYTKAGATFVFSAGLVKDAFAFSALPVIFFFSCMIQILYYWGAMQWVILKLGWMLQSAMGTTVCESLNAVANTFLGMTESPLLIKPYISKLTTSELHAVMCSGFATVSGSVMAAYIRFGADPAHLLTASVMSAPAALCYSKLFYPETEKSETKSDNIPLEKTEDKSVMDAATKGAMAGIPLVLGIVANIVAFVSLIEFLNAILTWFGSLVGYTDLTFELILSKVFMPLSWMLGVPWDQCEDVATLIGLKTVVNEFVAYKKLGEFKSARKLTPRTEAIATYAICGFSNPGSIGIMMGGLGSMAPTKRQQIAQCITRAFIAGSAVCFLTACTAGMLIDDDLFSTALQNSTTMASLNTSLY